jgi:peptidyl-prolyl cis-trans isomerase SurA
MNTARLRQILCICALLASPELLAQSRMATSLSSPDSGSRSPVADEIVAVVNTDVITRNELRIRVNSIERGLQAQGTPLPPVDVLNRQVLERMIDERAELQQAKDDGIRVDDFTVDRTIVGIAAQNKMTPDQFRKRVEADGTDFSQFRDDIRNQIIISRLRDHEVDSSVQVSEGEIDNFIAQQAGLPPENRELDLAEILIRVPEQASAEQIDAAKKKADDVYDQAAGGADFAKLAVTYSNAPDYQNGGDMGWKTTDHYPQLFTDAVKDLTPGQTAKPVKSPVGFHILKLIGRRTPGAEKTAAALGLAPVQQTHVRHILIRVNEVTSEAQAKARLEEIRQRILSGKATFEDMARAYSADGSAAKGGDLGNVFPGDTVPDFERAMNQLPIGGISEPITTQFGVHLIQVVGRSTESVPEARVRLLAKQAVHDRKVAEAYEDWVRSVRDEAYVEIRLLDDRS